MEFFIQIKPVVVIIHAFAGAIGIGATTVTDTLFFKFLSDRIVSTGEKEVMDVLSKVLWVALFILILSGVALFLSNPAGYAASSKFLVKVCIVAVIVFNGILLSTYLGPNLERLQFNTKESLGQNIGFKRIAFIAGVVSISSWYASFFLGLMRSIPLTFVQGILVYVVVVLSGAIISQLVLRKFSKNTIFDEI